MGENEFVAFTLRVYMGDEVYNLNSHSIPGRRCSNSTFDQKVHPERVCILCYYQPDLF